MLRSKKLVFSLIVLSALCIFTNKIYADEQGISKEEFLNSETPDYNQIINDFGGTVINEYEKAVEDSFSNMLYFNLTNDESFEKIENISKPYLIKKEISNLANSYEKEELKEMGFSEKQVNAISSARGLSPDMISDTLARNASANLSISLEKNWSNDKRSSFICYWAWQSAPIWNGTDTLAFAFTEGYETSTESTMLVKYHPVDSSIGTGEKRFSPTPLVSGAKFEFPQALASGAIRDKSNGKAYMVLTNNASKNYLSVDSSYIHYYGSPYNVSVGYWGISIGGGAIEAGRAHLVVK